jgi:DNA topoisomerase III
LPRESTSRLKEAKGIGTPATRAEIIGGLASAAQPAPAQPNSVTDTPLRIPYGNKAIALKLGARYRSGAWFAPPGVDLSSFRERGWL